MIEWQTFLSVQAEAAATLTGLVFVAVSINLDKITTLPGVASRAAESILHLLGVFLIATVVLIPGQSVRALAWEILIITAVSWVVQVAGQIQYVRERPPGHPWWWLANRVIQTQLATIPFFVAGLTLLLGMSNALYWLVPGFVFSFVAAMMGAWILLIEIRR